VSVKPSARVSEVFDVIQFGIITPTYKRARFLPSFIENVRRQTYSSWTLTIVHDGPASEEIAETVSQSAMGESRIRYLETPVHRGDMGNGPRLFGIQNIAETMPTIQYILFWDDDNKFFPDALANIDQAIRETGNPDLLLVPITHKWRSLPSRGLPLRALPMGHVDTGNLCVKTDTANKHFAKSQHQSDFYHHDFYFYRSICDDQSARVCLANIDNIGCYDGLRFWETIRWKVWPRPLQIYDTKFMRQIRRLIPRG